MIREKIAQGAKKPTDKSNCKMALLRLQKDLAAFE